MLTIKVVIGDVEYDTGSFISNQPENEEDWAMVLDMITDSVNFNFEGE